MADGNLVEQSILKIDTWLKATKTKEYRLGLLACANPRAVERVRGGGGTVKALSQILDFIDANPDGV